MKLKPAYHISKTLYTIIGLLGFYFFFLGLYQQRYFFAAIMIFVSFVALDNVFCQTRKKHYILTKNRS